MAKPEEILQEKVANYLVQNYPDLLFHSDYGSGAKLTKGQSAKQKRLNGGRRAWPDLVIAQPRAGSIEFGPFKAEMDERGRVHCLSQQVNLPPQIFCGLYLELKKEEERLHPGPRSRPCNRFKSIDGVEYRTRHFMEQADVLEKLRQRGYFAAFAVGYDEAINMITTYLGEPIKQEVEF